MKVKIGDKIFDSDDEPIEIILSDGEKSISEMGGGVRLRCISRDEVPRHTIVDSTRYRPYKKEKHNEHL